MKAYKGFDEKMTCRGFQFKEGETYEHEGEVKLCESGFHACENPIDCLRHYSPNKSVYREVELDGVTDERDSDTKRVGKKITIGARLDIPMLCNLTFDYVKEHCTNENNAEKGKPATAGDYGVATAGKYGAATAGDKGVATAGKYGAATAGDYGVATAGKYGAATAGNCGVATAGDKGAATAGNYSAATAGYYGAATAGNYSAATAGDCGAATAGDKGVATAGDCGAATAGDKGVATAGEYGAATAGNYSAATAGYYGAATAGNYSAATSRGSSSSGKNGLSVARGKNVKVKGGLGAILVIAEEDILDFNIKDWKAVVVDGKAVKADTWYKLENGELKEVEEEQ